MWDWIATSINQGPVEKKLVGEPSGKRRATFLGSTITEVKLDDLDASSKQQSMKVTVTVVPKQIAPAKAAADKQPGAAQKSFRPSNFKISIDGVELHKVSKIDSITIKQGVVKDDSAKAMVLDSARITLGAADAKKLSSAIAKGTAKTLSIALTNDDGSTWKTLSVSGLKVQSTKTAGACGSITIKGSKILMN